jgi:hemin uptake protein HemP
MADSPSLPDGRAERPQRPETADPPRGPVPLAICSGRRLRSADLFGSQQEVEIEHGQAVYRLRLTSLGKLILTK